MTKYDTSYYVVYKDKLIVSPFVTKAVNAFSLAGVNNQSPLHYFVNRPGGLGIRLGYDFLAFDFAFATKFFDPDFKTENGKPKGFDLRTTFAPKSFLLDVYLQKHKGFYLRNSDDYQPLQRQLYMRPDISSQLIGTTFQYTFNGKRFATRPLFKVDAWQKRSAGSLLLGAEVMYGTIKGDSSLVPAALDSHTPITRVSYLMFGPGVGYGHTFVYKKHFYASLIGGINGNVVKTKEWSSNDNDLLETKWQFSPNINFRGGIGYNNENMQVSFFYFTNRMFFRSNKTDLIYQPFNNTYKLNFTKRINAGKTIPRVVHWIGNIIEAVGLGFLIR